MKIARGIVFESDGELYLSMVENKSDAVLRCISHRTKKLTVINSSRVDKVLSPDESQKMLKAFF